MIKKKNKFKVKDEDIAAIKKEMMRCYDPIEYDQTYWSQTDDVMVELLDVIFDYCSLADSYVTLCREYGDEV